MSAWKILYLRGHGRSTLQLYVLERKASACAVIASSGIAMPIGRPAAVAAVARRKQQASSKQGSSKPGSSYELPVGAPPLESRGGPNLEDRALATVRKALKEASAIKRRAAFGWRHMRAGVLAFQSGTERRTFAVGKKLGEGGYSTIWRVHEWQPDGSEKQFAVKRVILDRRDPEQVELVEHEISVMKSLPPHPNVVEIIGTCRRQRGSAGAQDEVFLLLELCRGGSLADLLMARAEAKEPLSADEVAKAFHDMALGIAHLHSLPTPLAHRDVKCAPRHHSRRHPNQACARRHGLRSLALCSLACAARRPENFILSDMDNRWRLCDFGSSTTHTFTHTDGMRLHEVANEEDKVHRYSTPQYRAPEMCDLRRGETIGIGVDVWALGVSLYKLLFLRDLFGTPGEERLGTLNFDPAKKLASHAIPTMPPESAASSEALLNLLRACLTPSAAQRPSVHALLQRLRSSRVDAPMPGARRPSYIERADGSHTAGMLTIRELHASGLYPKAASSGGVKPYVLLTCGGQRRVTAVAPKGHEASWGLEMAVATHGLQTLEMTVWAFHRRTTHDFLGAIVLSLHTLIHDPTVPTRLPLQRISLQKRSHKSHVAGELALSISWEPFATTHAPLPGPPTHTKPVSPPPADPPSPHLLGEAAAARPSAGDGAFWSAGFADDFASFDPLPPAASAVATPAQCGTTMEAPLGGSFWTTDAAATNAWSDLPPPCATAPSSMSSNPAPPPLRFTSSATDFESVSTVAAPWEKPASAAASTSSTDPGTFWATFDAAPGLTATPPAAPVNFGDSLISFGGDDFANAPPGDFANALAALEGGGAAAAGDGIAPQTSGDGAGGSAAAPIIVPATGVPNPAAAPPILFDLS